MFVRVCGKNMVQRHREMCSLLPLPQLMGTLVKSLITERGTPPPKSQINLAKGTVK